MTEALLFLLGWLVADAITGIFHWAEDSFGNERTPIIGQWLIRPNRLHHVDPLAFTRHGFWQRNYASIAAALAVGIIWLATLGPSSFMLAVLLGSALANEVHFYAHRPSLAPAPVQWLQAIGFLQSARQHAAHHRPPYERNFCILTDWLNPLVNWVRR